MSEKELREKGALSVEEIGLFGEKLHIFTSEGSSVPAEQLARTFARATGGQVYTQFDSEIPGDVVYRKGWHVANRTGVYAVVIHSEE